MESSLDPRVKRLPKTGQPDTPFEMNAMEQFGTFEVFVQPREGKPFQHEGIVHAPDAEMAFILAKETFTRRFTCASLCVVETRLVFVSPMTEGNQSVYEVLSDAEAGNGPLESYEVYHLAKRGKQHVHALTVRATTPAEGVSKARDAAAGKAILNVWTFRTADARFATEEEKILWNTLPEKKFRDAVEYKGGEKLKQLLERLKSSI